MSDVLPDERQERAALLIAEGTHMAADVAKAVGVTPRTLQRWRNEDAFACRVRDICDQFASEIVAQSIADRQYRVSVLDGILTDLLQVVKERGTDPALQDVPGGKTGRIIRTFKQLGQGKDAQLIPEYAVDTGLLREMRDTMRQAAQELGQWAEKSETKSEQNIVFSIDFDRRDDSNV